MRSADAPALLVGRDEERRALSGLLAGARAGRSAVLVIRGEAGIGKTALLDDMCTDAHGFLVLHICGAELEMELPYAALQQLCNPLLPLVDGLPPPQRTALRVALGLDDGPPSDRLLVGLAMLTLFGTACGDRPTLCIVDDAQWIDTASLQTLGFVARRILAEPLAMVFAARDAGAEAELRGQPDLVLGGLPAADSRALLASVLAGRLDPQVEENILAEAKGNPLALLELHRALTPAELAGGFGLARAADPQALEHSFTSRLQELPAATSTLLLVAAADPAGRPEWLWAAAARLGVAADATGPAESHGLITVDNGIRFRHPLIRAAVYRGASRLTGGQCTGRSPP